MGTSKKTIVLGASTNPERTAYEAIRRLKDKGHEVIAIGKNNGTVHDLTIQTDTAVHSEIDTMTLYLNASHQQQWYPYILATQPRRLIFNPGTENSELRKLAQHHGIQTEEACTLVLLKTEQY